MDLEEVTPVVDAEADQVVMQITMLLRARSMPNLSDLLRYIVQAADQSDQVQLEVPADWPENWPSEVLKAYPQLVTELNKGWQERSFARVRGMIMGP
jgi:hypothetical protein